MIYGPTINCRGDHGGFLSFFIKQRNIALILLEKNFSSNNGVSQKCKTHLKKMSSIFNDRKLLIGDFDENVKVILKTLAQESFFMVFI